jgi:phosphatidylglycerol:prolipoprotein diacylglycerol transferase
MLDAEEASATQQRLTPFFLRSAVSLFQYHAWQGTSGKRRKAVKLASRWKNVEIDVISGRPPPSRIASKCLDRDRTSHSSHNNCLMRRTLIFISHEFAGLPVLGFGWLLILIGVALTVRLVIAKSSGQSIARVLSSEGVMWGVAAAAIVFVLPNVELKNVDGDPVGMAIRGYGVMLLAGVSSAVALAAYRAKKRGLNPDLILSMAPWVFVGGILGARIFYVIQYHDQFTGESLGETVRNMLAFTEGGLVVYGSFIGGFLAGAIFITRRHLPLLKLGDVIVPCMFIGVFFGRIGCLMNGCCYGGRCEDHLAALRFPAGSAVYGEQIGSGELLGLDVDPVSRKIRAVGQGTLADNAGIRPGGMVNEIAVDRTPREAAPRDIPAEDVRTGVIATIDGKRYRWSPDELPENALPVQPAQLISSFSALGLCLLLCLVSFHRDGTVMMLGFAGYAVLRFVLELVRVDEGGQFGTSLSISQWVSVVVLGLSITGLVWIYSKPNQPVLQPTRSAKT